MPLSLAHTSCPGLCPAPWPGRAAFPGDHEACQLPQPVVEDSGPCQTWGGQAGFCLQLPVAGALLLGHRAQPTGEER